VKRETKKEKCGREKRKMVKKVQTKKSKKGPKRPPSGEEEKRGAHCFFTSERRAREEKITNTIGVGK